MRKYILQYIKNRFMKQFFDPKHSVAYSYEP